MKYIIFTDGSYKECSKGKFYSAAATIEEENNPDSLVTLVKCSGDELVSMRNVAGEILAVMMAMEHCLNVLKVKQEDILVIHYDYVGIANWVKKKGDKDYWRAKNLTTQAYRNYINTIVRTRVQLKFVHTPGHSGIYGNERVDFLARRAIERHIEDLDFKG